MEAYIAQTLNQLKSEKYGDVSIVLGNESCDLDSAVCAVVYSSFLYWQYNQIKCKVCTRHNRDETVYKNDLFLPVLNVPRKDFPLKTEVAFCFKQHGVDETKLIFRDDYNLQELVTKSKTSVVLVDHHKLSNNDRFLAPYVTEIIDHRHLDKTDWDYKPDTRASIEITGSCATLVAQRIRSMSNVMSKSGLFLETYPIATDLLHSTIILDTVNFSKEVDKATSQDVEVVEYLETFLKPASPTDTRKCKLEQLVEARKDVTSLTAAQLLRKDVKVIGDVLVPSFPVLVADFLKKPSAVEAVKEALTKTGCSIAVLLGMCLTSGLKRDTAFYTTGNSENLSMLIQHLTQWSKPSLQLTATTLATAPGVAHYTQTNLSASRKQYVQALNEYQQRSSE